MNSVLFIIYTILMLIVVNYVIGLIFNFFNINMNLYGAVLAWLNGIIIFVAILPASRGDIFK